MKRLISIILAALLILSLLPTVGFAAKKLTPDDAFAAIDEALEQAKLQRATLTDARKTQIAKAAVEKLGYQTEARGDGCFTFVIDGEPCIFNCRMYNILSEMEPIEGYVDDGQIVTVDYSTRSTGPSDGAKDVVLIEPFYGKDSSFTRQYQNEASSIAKATGGTYTLYKTSAATIDAVADGIENAAVVIFDSHGDTDYYETPDRGDYVSEANTSYLLLATGTGLTSADKSRATGEFSTYNHAYSSGGYYYVDGTAITNHMEKAAPNNLVWMAICLGMATDGLEKPFRDHGVGVVYGYSQSVTFDGDYDYEATFWTNMKNGEDVATSISAMKKKYGDWDPGMGCSSISSARREYAAFPIVVSDLDTYPGHGNVDALQTVFSDWSLFGTSDPVPAYTVNAKSSDPALGTVKQDGNVITADPQEGCVITGYSVSPEGACKVTQNGNKFTVSNVTADCTVTILFAEREKAAISFSVPDGVSCASLVGYVGDSVKLPTPQGVPTADRYDYRFIGWSDQPLEDTTENPDYFAAGRELTLTGDRTLYALYTYYTADGDGLFREVVADKEDFSGDYVISYDGKVLLDASGTLTGTSIGGQKAAIAMEDTDIVLLDDMLYNVDDSLIYRIEAYDASAGTYTVKMKNSEVYLLHSMFPNAFQTTDDPSDTGALWKLSFANGHAKLQNAATSKLLQYNPTNNFFRCYSTGTQEDLTLYCGSSGATYFTTELKATCAHEWDEGVISVEPACIKNGVMVYTCSLCGEKRTESIPALGHDYVNGICSRCGDEDPNYIPPECPHENTEVRDAVEPDCTQEGYTGDIYCIDCGELLGEGSAVDALGHSYVDGVCERCGAEEPVDPVDPCEGYEDIDRSKWYHSAADFVIEKGYMGSTKTDRLTFEPNVKVSRAMVASILYRIAADGETAEYAGTFSDVPEGKWYTTAIEWCAQNGLASGKGSGIFDPDGDVTRQELAVFMYKLADYLGRDVSGAASFDSFADGSDVPAWSAPYLAWAVDAGIISGQASDGVSYLNPTTGALRSELASILMRFFDE